MNDDGGCLRPHATQGLQLLRRRAVDVQRQRGRRRQRHTGRQRQHAQAAPPMPGRPAPGRGCTQRARPGGAKRLGTGRRASHGRRRCRTAQGQRTRRQRTDHHGTGRRFAHGRNCQRGIRRCIANNCIDNSCVSRATRHYGNGCCGNGCCGNRNWVMQKRVHECLLGQHRTPPDTARKVKKWRRASCTPPFILR